MNNIKPWFSLFILILLISPLSVPRAKAPKENPVQNPRLKNLSDEDKEMFNALTKKQQKNLEQGKIETDYNAWMVRLALGEPYYASENHPLYKDYEEVWLYTRDVSEEEHTEERIMDPVTNWPTVHVFTRIKTCKVGDFFLLYDRGVVEKIIKDKSNKTYGSCTIKTSEEFWPIVDGKVIKK